MNIRMVASKAGMMHNTINHIGISSNGFTIHPRVDKVGCCVLVANDAIVNAARGITHVNFVSFVVIEKLIKVD